MKRITKLLATLVLIASAIAISGCNSCSCFGEKIDTGDKVKIQNPIDWSTHKDNAKLRDPDAEACLKKMETCRDKCLAKLTTKDKVKRCAQSCSVKAMIIPECSKHKSREEIDDARYNSPYQDGDPRYFKSKRMKKK